MPCACSVHVEYADGGTLRKTIKNKVRIVNECFPGPLTVTVMGQSSLVM